MAKAVDDDLDFTLHENGRPLVAPRNVVSICSLSLCLSIVMATLAVYPVYRPLHIFSVQDIIHLLFGLVLMNCAVGFYCLYAVRASCDHHGTVARVMALASVTIAVVSGMLLCNSLYAFLTLPVAH